MITTFSDHNLAHDSRELYRKDFRFISLGSLTFKTKPFLTVIDVYFRAYIKMDRLTREKATRKSM